MSSFSLFPVDKDLEITSKTRPLTQTGSIQVFIQLAEPNLFVQGFEPQEYQERPPTLLRGSLIIRVLKTSKIRNINLTFKGIARTEWPEGIPPKRQEYFEENVIVNHTWPFYNHSSDNNSSGASIVKPATALPQTSDDISSLSLDSATASIINPSNALSMIKRATSPSPAKSKPNALLASLKATATNTSAEQSSDHHFIFQPGDYIYNFEHPIPSSTPETIDATFGSVSYKLHLSIERIGAFKSTITSNLPIKIIRAQSDESVEDSEPIAISRDWEDQLHYDIIIASKAMILNAYLPVAFKLIPLDKIKLHRIRIYLTENLEYYCRDKKVHRMEPVRKFLLLEHKAPPPPNLPVDADPKLKKMGNLLTSDGFDITAKEFEFQVYVPQKLNNRQNLHPNTSYSNIKSHHWIKICLRLSRIMEGKPKHYEISIDSPIHVLDPFCSHANTLLPAYGGFASSSSSQIHDSNIYFPREVLSSPPLSPEVEAVDNSLNSIYQTLNSDHRGRSSSSVASHSFPNFESTMSANVYKPNHLTLELTSPQAVPISPGMSPVARPIHLLRRPSFEPPPFDADISPPPMRDLVTEGIDAIMDNAPRDPPTYDEYLEEEARSPSPQVFRHSAPEIKLTPSSKLVPNGADSHERVGRSKKPKDAESDEEKDNSGGDLGDEFKFRGSSPNMPDSVARATSSDAVRLRSSKTSPRHSVDINNGANITLLPTMSSTPKAHDIDTVLRGNYASSTLDASSQKNDSKSLVHKNSGKETRKDEGKVIKKSHVNRDSDFLAPNERSSSSSPSSIRSSQIDSENEFVSMEPLLQTTSTTSYFPMISRRESSLRNPNFDQFESKESLNNFNSLNAENSSIDITALYSSNGSNLWHPFQDGTPHNQRVPLSSSLNANDTKQVFDDFKTNLNFHPPHKRMSFGAEPSVLATSPLKLDPNGSAVSQIEEADEGSQIKSISSKSTNSADGSQNNSSSTLTNVNDDVLHKHIASAEPQSINSSPVKQV